jgi:hypothetical protein
MGLRFVTVIFASFIAATALLGAARADGFLRGYEDLPLMAALVDVPDANVTFDSVAGRIIIAVAEGPVSAGDVLRYYRQLLPQLGWQVAATKTAGGGPGFVREDEYLVIDFPAREGPLTVVRFTLTPRP